MHPKFKERMTENYRRNYTGEDSKYSEDIKTMKLLSETCLWQLNSISSVTDDEEIEKLIGAWTNNIFTLERCDQFSDNIVRDCIKLCLELGDVTNAKIKAFMHENGT